MSEIACVSNGFVDDKESSLTKFKNGKMELTIGNKKYVADDFYLKSMEDENHCWESIIGSNKVDGKVIKKYQIEFGEMYGDLYSELDIIGNFF